MLFGFSNCTVCHGTLCKKVAEATTLMKMMFAAPAWWGRTSAWDRERLSRFLAKTKRAGYLRLDIPDVEQLMRDADLRLLTSVSSNPNHVLQNLFPPEASHSYNLLPRLHNFTLPPKDNSYFIPYMRIFSSLNHSNNF